MIRDTEVMTRSMLFGAMFSIALLFVAPVPADAGEPSGAAKRGMDLFRTYCATCHGRSGKGDGPIAEALKTPPSDLTQIAARNKGVFPKSEVRKSIDGRRLMKIHGPSDMPVWGARLTMEVPGRKDRKEAHSRNQITLLIKYLESIQAAANGKAPAGKK